MVKAFTFLLIFLVVLAMFGRLKFPGKLPKLRTTARCRACGRPTIGKGPCDCEDKA